eukprot:Colp12_sorted_trinity150504_noHs@17352
MKSDFNWVRKCGTCLVGMSGELTDCEELFSILEGECSMHGLNFHGRSLSSKSIAYFCRHTILDKGLYVRALVAGFEKSLDEETDGAPKLYWIDETAALQDVSYAAHGQEAAPLLSMLDQNRHQLQEGEISVIQNETAEQDKFVGEPLSPRPSRRSHAVASRVAKQCWSQLRKRSTGRIDVSTSRLYCIDKDGVQELHPDFTAA